MYYVDILFAHHYLGCTEAICALFVAAEIMSAGYMYYFHYSSLLVYWFWLSLITQRYIECVAKNKILYPFQ